MSVYKPKGSRFFVFDFERGGRRFSGSTQKTERRAAERVEEAEKRRADHDIASAKLTKAQVDGTSPMTVAVACARYWDESGKYLADPKQVDYNLQRLVLWFGETIRLDAVTDNDIAKLVAERRGEHVKRRWKKPPKGRRDEPLVSAATVNRTTIDVLRSVFSRARKRWRIALPLEPNWSEQRLEERGELVNEMSVKTEAIVGEALSPGYRDLWKFSVASGLRKRECFLDWKQIDLDAETITVIKKGGKQHVIPASREMLAILSAQPLPHTGLVFRFARRRALAKLRLRKGEMQPVTYEGLKSEWERVTARLGIKLRFHDMRHTRATRLLRRTGNLKHVQQLLGHADIKTTAKFYAHVTMDDLRAALNAESPVASPMDQVTEVKKAQS